MAEVPFPYAQAQVTALEMVPKLPAQIAHESPFTGQVQVLSRGYGFFAGRMEIARTREEAKGLAIEAFFTSLQGWKPLHRGLYSAPVVGL